MSLKLYVTVELTVNDSMRKHKDKLITATEEILENMLIHELPSDLAQMYELPYAGVDVDELTVEENT